MMDPLKIFFFFKLNFLGALFQLVWILHENELRFGVGNGGIVVEIDFRAENLGLLFSLMDTVR